jgi:hypothetical protein
MTNDDELVAYLSGVDGATVDDVTRAELDDLKSTLGDDTVWALPPSELEDAVVAAIASQSAVTAPTPTRHSRRWSSRASRALLAGAAAVVIGVGVTGIVLNRHDEPGATLRATFDDGLSSAALTQFDSGWRIELDAPDLPRRDDGQFYEAWLRDDDSVLVSIGTFNEGDDVVLWAGVPPTQFSTITITREVADGDPASSGDRALVGTIVAA